MKEEESHSALPQLAMSSTHIALPLTPYDSDRFSHSQGASTPPSLQSPSSSPAMQSSPRQLRRWSSVNVSSTPLRSLAVHQTGSQLNPTRLRRHSQADTIIPSQGPARRVSSRSRSPTPGMGQSSMQANQVLQPIADTPTQAHGMTSASSSNTAMSSNSNLPDRQVVVCDGYLVDEESVQNALRKPDKLLHLYECLWDRENTPCRMWVEGDQASIADHLQHFHGFKGGETTTRCLWQDCPKRNMKGTSIARHVVTHVGFRIKCDTCKHEFARGDACNRAHSRSGCTGVGQPMYGELQLVLDARKADFGYRHMKKRRLEDP
ncbi:hypothetical protein ID866_7431 [Astraeus odoratus]|nr:hypothetical protein ID866_7431 [Astraeus odoratus]